MNKFIKRNRRRNKELYEDVQLHCHHVLPIESADVSNCITLCKSCHKKVHKIPDCNYHELRCSNETT